MQRIDVVIVAALVLAAAGSALGVMTYEDRRGATFNVTWATIVDELSADPLQIAGNSQAEAELDVPFRNITTAFVRVTVGATLVRATPTAVLVELTVPDANGTLSAEGTIPAGPPTSITVEVPVDLGTLPTDTTIRASSPDAAIAQLDAAHGRALGIGNWTVLVSVAPTAPGPLANEPYDVAIVAEITTYRAEVAVQTPGVPR